MHSSGCILSKSKDLEGRAVFGGLVGFVISLFAVADVDASPKRCRTAPPSVGSLLGNNEC